MPTPVWRPSLVANLILEFDPLLYIAPPIPDPKNLNEILDEPTLLTKAVGLQPLILRKGVQNASFLLGRVPVTATVEMAGYRAAATYDLQLLYKDLPIDPRTVRAAAVEIHLGSVSNDDFARGIRSVSGPGNSRTSILQTRTETGEPNQATLLMVGIVDEWEITMDDKTSMVAIKGRDLRGPLIDIPVSTSPGKAETFFTQLDLSKSIDEVVAQALHMNPLFQEFTVKVNPAEWGDEGVPSPGDRDILPRVRQGAKGKAKAAPATMASSAENVTYWDVITRLCFLCGAIPYFQGHDLLIRPSRSIFQQQRAAFDPTVPTPFAGGRTRALDEQTGEAIWPPLTVRQLVYGRDLKSLNLKRKFGGLNKPQTVRVGGLNPSSTGAADSKFIQGQWPPNDPIQLPASKTAARQNRMAPNAAVSQEDILFVPVHGITSPPRLEAIARAIFEEIGRGEMGGSFETPALASFGGGNLDPDLLRLRPGDGVEIAINLNAGSTRTTISNTLIDSQRRSFDAQVKEVLARLGNNDENLARVLVATSRGQIQEVLRFFRITNVRYSWGGGTIRVGADFQNYVVARFETEKVSATPGFVRAISSGRLV